MAATERRRAVLVWLGATLVAVGFALIPALTRSAAGSQMPSAVANVKALSALASQTSVVMPRNDPFARPLPGVNESKRRPSHPLRKGYGVRVDAIIIGKSPRALISRGKGDAEIVGVGDVFDSTRVASIAANVVVLEDGRRLALSEVQSK